MLKALVCFLLLATSPALAEDAPTVDFTLQIVVDGNPFINDFKCPLHKDLNAKTSDAPQIRDCDTKMTLGELAYLGLERPTETQDWESALKHDDLAHAVRTAKNFPLLPEQRTMIEKALGSFVTPSVIGAIAKMLSPGK